MGFLHNFLICQGGKNLERLPWGVADNINAGRNQDIVGKSETLAGYAAFTAQVRRYSESGYEGIEKGRAESKIEVARSMLADGLPAETVRKYTGLGEKEILAIQ
jgi:predicted transposase YdaD